MKFSEIKNNNQEESGKQAMSEYLRTYLHEDRLKKIDEIRDIYVSHLFEDLSKKEVPFNFRMYLKSAYEDSNNHAGDCIRRSLYVQELLPRDIKFWTEGALKCFDYFLLIYIQDVCCESINCFSTLPKETDVYEHLIKKGGDAQTIGEAFKYIYQYRNQFYHVHYNSYNGRREIKKTSNKQYKQWKEGIVTFFNTALLKFRIFDHTVTTA